jgi:sulfur carrier protein
MNLIVNGDALEMEGSPSISSVLDHLGVARERLAVELNQNIVPKAKHETTQLSDGDRLEIVGFVGGG